MFLLGPGAGIAVGLISVAVMDLIRRKIGIRRDYESLYSLGVAFAAYSAAEAVHGSGFLAAFSAGLVIAIVDVELCDCFLEYGETTAEMALLFTFVLFGTSLIWTGLAILNLKTLLFVIAALLVRPVAFFFSLARSNINKRGMFVDCLVWTSRIEFAPASSFASVCRNSWKRSIVFNLLCSCFVLRCYSWRVIDAVRTRFKT